MVAVARPPPFRCTRAGPSIKGLKSPIRLAQLGKVGGMLSKRAGQPWGRESDSANRSEAGLFSLFFPVAVAGRVHPFPFRTRKLSSPAPMVLPGQLGGRVGRRRVIFEKAVRSLETGQPFLISRGLDTVEAGHCSRIRAPELEALPRSVRKARHGFLRGRCAPATAR